MSINPSLVPTIEAGNLFNAFTTDQSFAVRWLKPTDPVYFETFNRPMSDIRLSQLIMAKTLDNFSVSMGYMDTFPFIITPRIASGNAEANVPVTMFHDCQVSVGLKWYYPRLIRVRRSGTNSPSYTGTVRMVFGAAENSASGPLRALFYVDYLIESDLDYQVIRIVPATDTTAPGIPAAEPSDLESIGGYIIFSTARLDQDGRPVDAAVRQFLDIAAPGSTGFNDYDVVDYDGVTGSGNDFNAGPIAYGTGVLTANAFNLVVQSPPESIYVDSTGTFYDATNKQIRNLADPTAPQHAVTRNYIDNVVGTINTNFLRVDGSNSFTGTVGPLNLGNSRIANLADPINDGDATNKLYIDTIANNLINRDGSVEWSASGDPLNMNDVKIINVGTPTENGDAVNKQYVDNSVSPLYDDFLRVDGSNTFTGTVNNLRMNSRRIVDLADPVDDQDAVTKIYVDSIVGFSAESLRRDGSNSFTGDVGPLNMSGNRMINLGAATNDNDALSRITADGRYLRRDGNNTMAGTLNVNNNRIMNVASPSTGSDAVNRAWVDNTINQFLRRDGSNSWLSTGTPLNMNNVRITGLSNATNDTDALNRRTADGRYLRRDGSNTVTGDLNVNNNRLMNVASPSAGSDAATKAYVDETSMIMVSDANEIPPNTMSSSNGWLNSSDRSAIVYATVVTPSHGGSTRSAFMQYRHPGSDNWVTIGRWRNDQSTLARTMLVCVVAPGGRARISFNVGDGAAIQVESAIFQVL